VRVVETLIATSTREERHRAALIAFDTHHNHNGEGCMFCSKTEAEAEAHNTLLCCALWRHLPAKGDIAQCAR
jgi:hypothetical protein